MDSASLYAKALGKLKARGAIAVAFTVVTPGAFDPLTETDSPPTSSTVSGWAVELPGDPEEYAAMELIGTEAITLMFAPDTLGDKPPLGSSIEWAGAARTVKQTFPIRPFGDLVAAKVILI